MPSKISRVLRAATRLSTLFGLLLIAVVWGGLQLHLSREYAKEVESAKTETSNLAQVLELHILRMVTSIDRGLHYMRDTFLADPSSFNLNRWANNQSVARDFVVHFSLTGADGLVKASTSPGAVGQAANNRECFQFHSSQTEDTLFISKPVRNASTGKWSIHFSRAIRDGHNNLLGVLNGTIDPADLTDTFKKLDLGRDGAVLLIGLDGVVRAVHGFKKDTLGEMLPVAPLRKRLEQSSAGSFFGSGTADGVRRYMSYRVLKGLPMVLTVGVSIEAFFDNYEQKLALYYAIAGGLTLLILLTLGWSVRKKLQLQRSEEELEQSRQIALSKSQQLEVVLEHIDKAILMEDADSRIVVYNQIATDLLGVPEDFLRSRPTRQELLRKMWECGEFGVNGSLLDPHIRDYLNPDNNPSGGMSYERMRPNGMVLLTNFKALPGGGYVRAFIDITERKRAEERIQHMATHDPLTGLANRALLDEKMNAALARMERFGEGFAVFCFDLDGFKKINDSYGHAAGDELLRQIAVRLREVVRDIDMVARTGGDEFVILQAAVNAQEQSIVLAGRLKAALNEPIKTVNGALSVGTSIGIALAPRHGRSIEELMKAADGALYRSKAGGRNLFRFAPMPKPPAPSIVPEAVNADREKTNV